MFNKIFCLVVILNFSLAPLTYAQEELQAKETKISEKIEQTDRNLLYSFFTTLPDDIAETVMLNLPLTLILYKVHGLGNPGDFTRLFLANVYGYAIRKTCNDYYGTSGNPFCGYLSGYTRTEMEGLITNDVKYAGNFAGGVTIGLYEQLSKWIGQDYMASGLWGDSSLYTKFIGNLSFYADLVIIEAIGAIITSSVSEKPLSVLSGNLKMSTTIALYIGFIAQTSQYYLQDYLADFIRWNMDTLKTTFDTVLDKFSKEHGVIEEGKPNKDDL